MEQFAENEFHGIQMIWKLLLISSTILRLQPPSLIMISESFLCCISVFEVLIQSSTTFNLSSRMLLA